jgi:uncharacterized protein (DUF433 family)
MEGAGFFVYGDEITSYIRLMQTDDLITVDPDILGGAPVFKGTRVPVKTLFDYLANNYTLEEFIDCFPSVTREMACRMLERSESALQAAAAQIQSAVATIKPGEFRHLAIP